MEAETWISCPIHVSQNSLFLSSQSFKNVKIILSSWIIKNSWEAGCGLCSDSALTLRRLTGPAYMPHRLFFLLVFQDNWSVICGYFPAFLNFWNADIDCVWIRSKCNLQYRFLLENKRDVASGKSLVHMPSILPLLPSADIADQSWQSFSLSLDVAPKYFSK